MPIIARETIAIAAPIEPIFAFVANLEHFPKWFPGVDNITKADNTPYDRTGKIYNETVNIPLVGKKRVKIEVKNILLNQQLITEANLTPLLPRMMMTFSQQPRFTAITWQMESRNENLLFHYTLLPLARIVLSRRAGLGLSRLKELLENNP